MGYILDIDVFGVYERRCLFPCNPDTMPELDCGHICFSLRSLYTGISVYHGDIFHYPRTLCIYIFVYHGDIFHYHHTLCIGIFAYHEGNKYQVLQFYSDWAEVNQSSIAQLLLIHP